MSLSRRLAILCLSLALAALPAYAADAPAALTPEQADAVNKLIHDYLMSNPKVLTEAMDKAADAAKAEADDAAKALPNSSLMRVELAQTELENTNDDKLLKDALENLHQAVKMDSSNADAWHQLGIAEGRAGNLGQAALALAEEGVLTGALRTASQQATRATQLLPRGTPGWIRAEDIRRDVKAEKEDRG